MDKNCFSQEAKEALGYYVYCLVDPRDKKIFYIGKGVGDRVFAHANGDLEIDHSTDKLDKIREIKKEDKKVEHYIIRHNLAEETAYILESALIDLLTYPKFCTKEILTNIVAGHHQWCEGIKTVDEIEQLYKCEKIKIHEGDKLLLVNLNKTFKRGVDVYEITRQSWRVSIKRANKINYVLGVYKGIVRCVIKPNSNQWQKDPGSNNRFFVEGDTNDQVGNERYKNKDATDYPFGSGQAIRYID